MGWEVGLSDSLPTNVDATASVRTHQVSWYEYRVYLFSVVVSLLTLYWHS